MKTVFNRFFYLPALVGAVLISACQKPGSIGIEVQPQSDIPGVFFTDTVTIVAETIREDSLRSDEAVAAFNLAGSYTDPVFGLSRASFYSVIRLPNNNTNFTFGNSPVLDSVVLTLAYADYYGDTLTPMEVEVYQTMEKMILDSSYYTHDELALGQMLFDGTVDVRPKDSVEVSGANRAPHLRLKLDSLFGESFLMAPSSAFADNDAFEDFFNGIYVKTADVTATGQGVVMSFNLYSTTSRLTFYYKNGTDTTQQTANFEVNNTSSRFNHFEHDYTNSAFGNTFPIAGDQLLYIQSMSGVKVRLKFPYLKNFAANGPVSINKAELVLSATDNSTFKNHKNLLVFGVDSAGKEALIPDLLESLNYYGGSYDEVDNTTKFTLSRHIQRIISGKVQEDYGLSLISSGGATNAFRTVAPGTSPTQGERIKLRLTYSKLD